MPGPSSLQRTLELARHDRPAALPADFADHVMARLPGPATRRTPRPAEAFAMAAAIVITAIAISLAARPRDARATPPPLVEFGGASGRTLFVVAP
jgi:hypothetical protein